MKFTLSLLVASLLVSQIAAFPRQDQQGRIGRGGRFGKGKGAGKGAGANGAGANAGKGNVNVAAGNATAGNAAAGNATAGDAAAAGTGAAAAANGKGAGGDAQTSLTLDPKVIAKGFAQDGQQVPAAGQVPSLTSTNNFINFCLLGNPTITNGQQVKGGSCNPAPMGTIPSTTNMPSSKFFFPTNLVNLGVNTAFTIKMAIKGMEVGNFVNAQSNYFSAPQQTNPQGQIKGHSHVVVEKMTSLTQTTPTDPNTFAFFKGLNDKAQGGFLTASVDKGLPAGTYRLCSINTAANHQPCLVPVAQHGTLDDCVYFTVGPQDKAAAAALANGGAAGAKGAVATAKGAAVNDTAAAGGAAVKGGAAAAGGAAAKGGAAAAGGAAAKGGAAAAGGAAKGGAAADVAVAKGGAADGAAAKGGAAADGAAAKGGAAKGGAGKNKARFARDSY